MLLCLANVAEFLARLFTFIYFKLCCAYCFWQEEQWRTKTGLLIMRNDDNEVKRQRSRMRRSGGKAPDAISIKSAHRSKRGGEDRHDSLEKQNSGSSAQEACTKKSHVIPLNRGIPKGSSSYPKSFQTIVKQKIIGGPPVTRIIEVKSASRLDYASSVKLKRINTVTTTTMLHRSPSYNSSLRLKATQSVKHKRSTGSMRSPKPSTSSPCGGCIQKCQDAKNKMTASSTEESLIYGPSNFLKPPESESDSDATYSDPNKCNDENQNEPAFVNESTLLAPIRRASHHETFPSIGDTTKHLLLPGLIGAAKIADLPEIIISHDEQPTVTVTSQRDETVIASETDEKNVGKRESMKPYEVVLRRFSSAPSLPRRSSSQQEDPELEEFVKRMKKALKEITPRKMPVSMGVLVVVLFLAGGATLFSVWEQWNVFEGGYFCFVTLTTIGFGELVPTRTVGQEKLIVTSVFLLVGMALIAMCFRLMQDNIVKKTRILGQKMGLIPRDVISSGSEEEDEEETSSDDQDEQE